jgi:hypothetical protein
LKSYGKPKKEKSPLRVAAKFMRVLNDKSLVNVKSSIRMPSYVIKEVTYLHKEIGNRNKRK